MPRIRAHPLVLMTRVKLQAEPEPLMATITAWIHGGTGHGNTPTV